MRKIFDTGEFNPWQDEFVHILLMTSNRMQTIPVWGISLILVGYAALTYLVWSVTASSSAAVMAGGSVLATNALNWLGLWLLPRSGRSFGPDRPSTLALGAVLMVLGIMVGLVVPRWWLLMAVCLILYAIAIYSTWIAPFRLGVTRQRLETDCWSNGVPPLRLLHLSDLHLERITQRERQLNHLVESLQPNLIVFSGDFVNISYRNDPTTAEEIRHIISQWQAEFGVFCVSGTPSVEPPARVEAFTNGMANLTVLDDDWETISTPGGLLHILGQSVIHVLDTDQATFKRLTQTTPAGGLKLMLTHAPDLIPDADAAQFDLYLCGHTHGGQIRLPLIGAVFTASALGRRFVMGRYTLENLTAYISRGIGMEGLGAPRARFLCPPEIILWEIYGTRHPADGDD